eukprot:3888269-Karenia_brevis.AAC.1
MRHLRSQALVNSSNNLQQQMLDMVTVDSIRKVARQFMTNTAVGPDHQGFKELAEATDEALADLVKIIQEIIETLAWPIQAHINQIALLGKKAGGSR